MCPLEGDIIVVQIQASGREDGKKTDAGGRFGKRSAGASHFRSRKVIRHSGEEVKENIPLPRLLKAF